MLTAPRLHYRVRACPPSTRHVGPPPVDGLRLPHLIGGERALRQTRIAEADFNFDDAVATNAGANGKRHAAEGELEIGDLQPLRPDRDLAVGREPRGPPGSHHSRTRTRRRTRRTTPCRGGGRVGTRTSEPTGADSCEASPNSGMMAAPL